MSVFAVRADKLPRALELLNSETFEGEFLSDGRKVVDYSAQGALVKQLNSEESGCAMRLTPVAGDRLFLPTEWPHMVWNNQVMLNCDAKRRKET